MSRYLILFSLIATSLLGGLQLLAQEANEGARTIHFKVYPALYADYSGLFYQAKPGEIVELEVIRRKRSDTMTHVGDGSVRFFRERLNPQTQLTEYYPVGSVEVPAYIDDALIFLFPETVDGEERIGAKAMDDSWANFPEDHVCFFNATGAVLYGVVGEDRVKLNVDRSVTVDVRPYLLEQTTVGFVVENNQTMQKVLHNTVRFYPGNRKLILLLPPQTEGSFRIRAVEINQTNPSEV